MLRRVMFVYLPLGHGLGPGQDKRGADLRTSAGYVGISGRRGAPSFGGLCGYICHLEWGPGKE